MWPLTSEQMFDFFVTFEKLGQKNHLISSRKTYKAIETQNKERDNFMGCI